MDMRSSRTRAVAFTIPVGLAVFGLATAGCGKSDNGEGGDKAGRKVEVSLTADGCGPSPASVPSGQVTFNVKNVSADKVREAELHEDDLIMGEKVNLTSGRSGAFSLSLKPGTYSLYCPNAKKDTWSFQVTGVGGVTALPPLAQELLATATTGYHDYIVGEVAKLVIATGRFTAAVKSGNVAKAKSLYPPARYFFEEIEPVVETFGDLDEDIDARVDGVDDPATWTGFHRLEKALWQDRSLKKMGPIADQLTADVAKLQGLAMTAKYQPAEIANGATELLNDVASSKITGEEDRYSHTDLSDVKANIDGDKAAFDLLKPALDTIDPQLSSSVATHYGDVLDALKPLHGDYAGTGYVDFSTVAIDQREMLIQKVGALAETLSQVAAKLTARP
jgi:iron uptake system component EfeO